MASFEGTAFERMTSEISRLREISSSELDVARSICSSIWVVDANQPAIMPGGAGRGVAVGAVVLFESRLVLLSAVYSDRLWCCRKVDDGAKLRVNNRHRAEIGRAHV